MENWFFWIFEKIFKIFFVSFIWNLLWKFEKWHKITIRKNSKKKFFEKDSKLLSLITNLPWKLLFLIFEKNFWKITIVHKKFTMKNQKMTQNYYDKKIKKIKKFQKIFKKLLSQLWNLLWKIEKWYKITIKKKKNQKISKIFFFKKWQ